MNAINISVSINNSNIQVILYNTLGFYTIIIIITVVDITILFAIVIIVVFCFQ